MGWPDRHDPCRCRARRPGSVLATRSGLVIPAAIEGTLTADVATLLTARLVVDGGCHRRQPDDRLRVLDHLERSWSVIAADDPDRWRSVTLTTALARVCKGLRGTAGINPRTRQRRFDWHVPAAPPGVGPVPCRWTTTTAP